MVADGDLHREFLVLFSASASRLYSYVSSLLGNAADADEAFQEVSCVLWTKFDEFKRDRDFATWALGIAHLVVLQQRRKTRRRLLMDEATLELVAAETTLRLAHVPDHRHALSHCLEKLSAADRQVLRLRYELQMKPKEMQNHLGRSIHAVYRSLARIHQRLLDCIQRTLSEAAR
jgi:RNA polymerase sigma-70 factor (ECF subfamily)